MRLGKDAKVELLKNVPLFSRLDKKALQDVAHIADELDLPAGKEMAVEGDRGREFFVLLDGEAEVNRRGARINTMKEGDFFGEISILSGKPRSATVTAMSHCEMLELDRATLDEITARLPNVRHVLEEFYLARAMNTAESPGPTPA